jgi:hypothetical protein
MIGLTFDGLRLIEILRHDFHTLNRLHMRQGLWKILQNKAPGNLRILLLKSHALMAKATSNIDKERFLVLSNPGPDFLFNWEHGQPVVCPLDHHDLLEVEKTLWLGRNPCEYG